MAGTSPAMTESMHRVRDTRGQRCIQAQTMPNTIRPDITATVIAQLLTRTALTASFAASFCAIARLRSLSSEELIGKPLSAVDAGSLAPNDDDGAGIAVAQADNACFEEPDIRL
jgi:hypothetical protein